MDFKDELICYQSALVNALKRFVVFLENNNFTYWASDGTCLGAVRHQNIIPWDDDIDIMMPRHDYDRLNDFVEALRGIGFSLMNASLTDMPISYSKVVDNSTTVWEQKTYPLTGIWIDIFPVDYISGGLFGVSSVSKRHSLLAQNFQRGTFHMSLSTIIAPLARFSLREFWHRLMSMTFYRFNKLRNKQRYLSFIHTLDSDKGPNLLLLFGNGYYLFNSEWFDGYQLMPFSDYMIRIPHNYKEYLTMLYGDYMQLPPKEARRTHRKLYVNLKERLSIYEVKKRLSLGKSFED